MPRRGLALAALLLATGAQAESVVCHVTYGGATQRIEAPPVDSPYGVGATRIGSFFLFRIVFRRQPADLAGIKVYAYADRDGGPSLIHQGSYAYPVRNAAVDGFSGRQFVYEPLRDSELQYWCELRTAAAA
ncbi:MAG TPA: hypothetical protein VF096_00065 [Azonexus sp.]